MRTGKLRKNGIRLLLVGTVAAAGAAALMPARAQFATFGSTAYHANLVQLNHSRATGFADVVLDNTRRTLTVHIVASGLERGGVHLSHIHGLSANGHPVDSTCPTIAQDSDRDGYVELAEGQQTYGPILIDFMNVDPDGDGHVDFRTRVRLTGTEHALPLDDRHIVVHGLSVGAVGKGTPGEVEGTPGYKTVLPVLCGELQRTR